MRPDHTPTATTTRNIKALAGASQSLLPASPSACPACRPHTHNSRPQQTSSLVQTRHHTVSFQSAYYISTTPTKFRRGEVIAAPFTRRPCSAITSSRPNAPRRRSIRPPLVVEARATNHPLAATTLKQALPAHHDFQHPARGRGATAHRRVGRVASLQPSGRLEAVVARVELEPPCGRLAVAREKRGVPLGSPCAGTFG